MKNLRKVALLLALGLAGIPAVRAAVGYNQDLLVGFTTGSGNDLIYDLGSVSSVLSGTAGVNHNDTWDLSSILTSNFGTSDFGNIWWGVIGDTKGALTIGAKTIPANTVFTTVQNPNPLTGLTEWTNINTATASIYSPITLPGAGHYATVSYAIGNSWYSEMINTSSVSQYGSIVGNATSLGTNRVYFNQLNSDGSTMPHLGAVGLDSSGILTYTVPEPATGSLLGGAGLLLLAVRQRCRRNRA